MKANSNPLCPKSQDQSGCLLPFRRFAILIVLFAFLALLGSACGMDVTPQPTMIHSTPTLLPTATSALGIPAVDRGAPLSPQIVRRDPAPNQEISPQASFEIVFDQPMDQAASGAALQVMDADGRIISGQVSWPDVRTLRFTPEAPLEAGKTYVVTISTSASSAQGTSLEEAVSWQFSTTGSLQVVQVFPEDGAADVEGKALITVVFNRPVVPLVIAEEQIKLPDPLRFSPPLAGQGEWVNGSVYVFRPDPALAGAVTYQVTVAAGLTDATGEAKLMEDYTWSFTTAAPSIAAYWLSGQPWNLNPGDKLVDVPLNTGFGFRFYQPMNVTSVESNLSIVSGTGEPVLLEFDWSEDLTEVVVTPTQRLAYDTFYTLTLGQEAQAIGGGWLASGLTWNFYTVRAPGIAWTMPGDRETMVSYFSNFTIQFNSPMSLSGLVERVVFDPPLPAESGWYYDEWEWKLYFFGLQPSVTYSVRILPGMADQYGTPIPVETVIRFTNGPYEPWADLNMPYDASLYRVDGPQEFYASYVNVSQVRFWLFRLPWETFLALENGQIAAFSYNPPAQNLVWERLITDTGALNEQVLRKFPLAGEDGKALEPGFYFLAMDAPEVSAYVYGAPFDTSRIFIVASANLTLKTTSTEALMWVTDLNSGAPMDGIPLSVYDSQGRQLGQGTTDADGLLFLQDLKRAPGDWYGALYVLAGDAQSPVGFAASRWDAGLSLYDYGIWSDYYRPSNWPLAYVYTERPIYRPGQPVYFKGVVRTDNDMTYRLLDETVVDVTISSYDEVVYQETLPLSEFGTFDGIFLLDAEAALGWYTIGVSLPGEQEVIGTVGFNVAEYRRPEFRVEVSAGLDQLLPGDVFSVTVQADYYAGGAVGGADVTWSLLAEPYVFVPPAAFSSYSFSDHESDYGYFYSSYYDGYAGPAVIAEGTGKTDASGQLVITLPAELPQDALTGRLLVLEATVSDLAGAVVSGRATVIVHRSKVYPGVRPRDYVGMAGEEQTIELTALDWNGNPLPGQVVGVEIVERRWYSVQQQDPQGRIYWSSSVEEILVASFERVVMDVYGKAEVAFIPPVGGVYRAKVTSLDETGNLARASAYLWVAGEGYVPWRQGNDHGFELIADQGAYAPGETAEILIASPFQGETYALVTIERSRIRSHEVVLLQSNSTIYRLPITPDMAPNIYVFVTIIKGVDDSNPRPDFRIGVVQLHVDTTAQRLTIELTPDRLTVGPGEKVTYRVKVTDDSGRPVKAEVSLSLSDLATLSLAAPNSIPILDYFYASRGLGVWTSMLLVNSIEYYNLDVAEAAAREAPGSGGGKGGELYGVIEVRQDFPDTAFWEARLLTDENGEAAVTVTLPDNLTTWRMDGRAVTLDTRVGQATVDIISTKPLLVRPQTPRFFVAGDRVLIGAAVHNNTDKDLTVEVTLNGQGVDLLQDTSQTAAIPAGQQVYVAWEISVPPESERVDLIFSVQGGGYADASRPTLGSLDGQGIPVYRYQVPETVGTAGQMLAGGTLVEAISLPAEYTVGAGSLVVRISPSLAAGMTEGLKYLEHYPYECIEQTISRFLPNVIMTRAYRQADLADPALEAGLKQQVEIALQRLYNWQNPDGGWGWWPGQESDSLTSAYVLLGLIEAREAGYTVSESVLSDGLRFLQTKVLAVNQHMSPSDLNRQAFLLYILGRAGTPNISRAVKLYEYRQAMAYYARAYLAWVFYSFDPGDSRVDALLSDLNSAAILSATGTHWEETFDDYWNWNTDTRSTAIILSILSQIDVSNPINANAVRWLMVNRTQGHWWTTQETAWSLMALTNWMVASGELMANYAYGVALNGKQLGGGEANAETLRQTYQLRVDIANLLTDQVNRLAIAREEGQGSLYYTAHLEVFLPVEKVKALERGILVSRMYYSLQDLDTPIAYARQGDLVLVRLTVIAPHDLHFVVIDDPLPAGLEAIDRSLQTSQQSVDPAALQWDALGYKGWGWWYFNHIEMRDEKIVLSATYLPAGTYVYTYLARASTVGSFRVIPPTAQEFYFPEVYGRGEGMIFEVRP